MQVRGGKKPHSGSPRLPRRQGGVPSLLSVARRRMTTPVVAPRSGLNPPTSNFLVLPLPRRHAWLAAPAANTCSRNRPQNKRQQRPPPHKTKKNKKRINPRRVAPAARRRRMVRSRGPPRAAD